MCNMVHEDGFGGDEKIHVSVCIVLSATPLKLKSGNVNLECGYLSLKSRGEI